LVVEIAGARFKVVEVGNELLAYSTVCPHKLGPLEDGEVAAGIVECPWHGYRFDLRTRECLRGQRCSLAPAPAIKVDHTEVIAEWDPR
jgi:nitrite reductase/ring-hydroxylating ferredoxin subunit